MSKHMELSETQQKTFNEYLECAKAYGRSVGKKLNVDQAASENAALCALASTLRSSDNICCVSTLKIPKILPSVFKRPIFVEVAEEAQRAGWVSKHRWRKKPVSFCVYCPARDRRIYNHPDPADAAELSELISLIPVWLAKLPALLRDIIQRIYFAEETLEQVARELGLTVSAVYRREQEALAMMRGGVA